MKTATDVQIYRNTFKRTGKTDTRAYLYAGKALLSSITLGEGEPPEIAECFLHGRLEDLRRFLQGCGVTVRFHDMGEDHIG